MHLRTLVSALVFSCGVFAQNLLTNPGFEEVASDGTAKDWGGKPPVYKVTEEYARSGKKSLYFKNDNAAVYSLCSQSLTGKIDKNALYRFGVYVKTRNVKGDGPTVCVEFCNGSQFLSGVYPAGLTTTNGEWTLVEGIIRSIPPTANSIGLTVYCREKTTGEAWFDDAFIEPYYLPLLSVATTDAYRDMIDGHRNLAIYAAVSPRGKLKPEEVPGLKLTLLDKSGKELMTLKPQPHDDASVRFDVPSMKLSPGEYVYRIEAQDDGKVAKVEGTFRRVLAYPQRKSYIDDHRRLIVDGKPFFPLGMYFKGIGEDYNLFKDSAFNCILPYDAISRKDVDQLYKDGKSVIYSVKDFYPAMGWKSWAEADAKTVNTINSLKDHPAVIAWYANDEMPVSMVKQLAERRALIEKTDPDRPAFVVQCQIQNVRDYLPCFDIIGTDPYPIAEFIYPGRALEWARWTTNAAFGVRANWMVPQVFNWAAYWPRYGKSVDEILKLRAPSYEEMKSMTWMCVAGGATGLIYYSWFDLVRMGKERDYRGVKLPADDFNKRWSEIKKMAAEVREHEEVLLAIDPTLELKATAMPVEIAMRAFGKGDETWVLLVNSDKGKSLSCGFEAPCAVVCRGVTLGESKPVINGKSVQITLKPLEAVFLRLGKK